MNFLSLFKYGYDLNSEAMQGKANHIVIISLYGLYQSSAKTLNTIGSGFVPVWQKMVNKLLLCCLVICQHSQWFPTSHIVLNSGITQLCHFDSGSF